MALRMRWFVLWAAVVAGGLGSAGGAVAATSASGAKPSWRISDSSYREGYARDFHRVLVAPKKWDKRDWKGFSLLVGATVGIYQFDARIHRWSQKNRSRTTDRISDFARPFGDGRYTLPGMGAFYLYGAAFKDERARKTGLLGVESFVLTGVFTQALKLSAHRHRPSTGDPPNQWDDPAFGGGNMSFPSGHASSAFAVMTVIAMEYHDKKFVPPIAYGIATLTALSRINDNAHWASDVFFGSAIGYLTARSVVRFHRNRRGGELALAAPGEGPPGAFLITFRF